MTNNKKLYERWKKQLKEPSSAFEILELTDWQPNIITYNNLKHIENIEELLEPFGSCVILIEIAPSIGHWVGLFVNKDKEIEFFDPYGLKPDEQLQFLPKEMVEGAYLTEILNDAVRRKHRVRWNSFHFQNRDVKEVSTCGRWVAARILLRKKLTLNEFKKILYKPKDKEGDYLVTALTEQLLKEKE